MSASRIVLAGVLALTVVAAAAPASSEEPSDEFAACDYSTVTHDVTITLPEMVPRAVVRRGANGALLLNGHLCDYYDPARDVVSAATVTKTRRVILDATAPPTFVLDLRGGRFAPGWGDEAGSSDEIEFELGTVDDLVVRGSGSDDDIRVGESVRVNLNAGEADGIDADVVADLAPSAGVRVMGGGGRDEIRGSGGAGTGASTVVSSAARLVLEGGDGADALTSATAGSSVSGGPGRDTFVCGPGPDWVDTGPGDETVAGLGGDDRFLAGPVADGADRYFGGGGVDRVSYETRAEAVQVTIDANANDGQPDDPLTDAPDAEGDEVHPSIEHVFLSDHDDEATGDGGDQVILGNAGDDVIDGGDGWDLLNGNSGDDTLSADDTGAGTVSDSVQGGAGADTFHTLDGVLDSLDFGEGEPDTLCDCDPNEEL